MLKISKNQDKDDTPSADALVSKSVGNSILGKLLGATGTLGVISALQKNKHLREAGLSAKKRLLKALPKGALSAAALSLAYDRLTKSKAQEAEANQLYAKRYRKD